MYDACPKSEKPSQRVLVVDDSEDSADMLRFVLESSGYEVLIAVDAVEALAMAERSVPDIAVIDIGLPGMDGNELARKLRSSVRTATCRLVALTGYDGVHILAKTKAAGFEAHLTKPLDMPQMLRILAAQ